MRENLFRGKCYDGKWVEGFYYKRTHYYGEPSVKHYIIVSTEALDYDQVFEYHEVIPETVGQFTGITDKNGKKIFEGDIVKTKYGRLCIVGWFSSPVHNGWDLETIRTAENCAHTRYPDSFDLYKKENLEVIGNICDNPELLEVQNV